MPAIPVDLPAQVLRSRPDITAAERRVLVVGTEAGVAQAAILPRLMVTGSVGFLSQHIDKLIKGNSTSWLIGQTLSIPVFYG
ncbi:TolC family protein [Spirosoma areae]